MKAIIKNGCAVTEPFDAWTKANLAYLTGTERDSEGRPLKGDGWTLVNDYHGDGSDEAAVSAATAGEQAQTAGAEKTYTIDGAVYTESQIRELQDKLSSVLNS